MRVGIFLGRRGSEGYSVNILSVSRRRDRIVIVFEERMPADVMMAQRAKPGARPARRSAAALRPAAGGFGGPGASFAPRRRDGQPRAAAPSRRPGNRRSPWAIILISRADLPVSVEQRLFR